MEPKDEVKGRLDIVDVIGESIPLKSAGSGNFKGICPFHGEKTPSFYVSREKDIWHCFGCDKGGDIFTFIMEFEGMSFPEALQYLGKKAGVEIPEFKPTSGADGKEILLAMHGIASNFYETILHKQEAGKIAREYLETRGIPSELAKKFHLGYASENWSALVEFLEKHGYSKERIIDAGLGKEKRSGDGLIDRFRGRLTIPLCDTMGNIIGFTGRILIPQENAPKYLNSPDTKIYHKSDVLFGLHLAKNAIRHQKSVIIVEGNLDVVASHKAGVENVVASSGTALTESQLRQLKKVTTRLIFSFDADAAGFEAAKRGIRLAQGMDFEIRVIQIPKEDGKDPDDVVQKDPKRWFELSKNPIHVMDYYFARGLVQFDVTNVDGKRLFAHFLIEEIHRLKDGLDQEHWIQALSDVIHVEPEILRRMISKPPTAVVFQQNSAVSVPPPIKNITTQSEQAVSFLFGLLFAGPDYVDDIIKRLHDTDIPGSWLPIYKDFIILYTQCKSDESTQNIFFTKFQDHLAKNGLEEYKNKLNASVIRAQEAIEGFTKDQVREEISRHLSLLALKSHDAKRKQLESAIRQAETSGDHERLKALMEEYTKLIS